MRRTTLTALLMAGALALTACASDSAASEGAGDAGGNGGEEGSQNDHDHGDPVTAEPLTQRHEFADSISVSIGIQPDGRDEHVVQLDDASRIAVAEITVAPGGRFPWHTHPGPALAAVTSNELIYIYADDCVERSYPAGTAFVDPGGDNIHTAYNPSTTEETTVMVTFLGAPEEGPLTLPVDDDEGAALDTQCAVDF